MIVLVLIVASVNSIGDVGVERAVWNSMLNVKMTSTSKFCIFDNLLIREYAESGAFCDSDSPSVINLLTHCRFYPFS